MLNKIGWPFKLGLGWNLRFTKNIGSKTLIIYHGHEIIVNIYWFLNYHPEDTYQDSKKIEDDPAELSVLFVKPRGFNRILFDSVKKT